MSDDPEGGGVARHIAWLTEVLEHRGNDGPDVTTSVDFSVDGYADALAFSVAFLDYASGRLGCTSEELLQVFALEEMHRPETWW